MTEFKVGARVRVLEGAYYAGREGVVHGVLNYPDYLLINLDGGRNCHFSPLDLEVIEDPAEPAKPDAKPGCYVTAWCCDDGEYAPTNDEFETKAGADEHAKTLAARPGEHVPVAVFKMVSKHSSAVTVTSEDV